MEDFGHVLESMNTSPTEIQSAEAITSSIHAFGHSLQNAFHEMAKRGQRAVEAFRLP